AADLATIIEIYNASIPARRATADTEPISVASRIAWMQEHDPGHHPLWVAEEDGNLDGWLSFQPFYGRPAYRATAELSVYVAPGRQRRGIGRALISRAIETAPGLGLRTLLGFVFGHNEASLRLFESFAFERWGSLPRVAELDGIERDVVILGRRVAGRDGSRVERPVEDPTARGA
ncbi:MAG: N-acetyltransferase family protein, partial [Candidatus Binatia bacterium]